MRLLMIFVCLCALAAPQRLWAQGLPSLGAPLTDTGVFDIDPELPTGVKNSQSIGVTVSGGVSLGVYQAGFLYVFTEVMKADNTKLRLFTGASAGSANALIAAVNSCLPTNTVPTADLGWKTWIDVSYSRLFDPKNVSSISVFNRNALIQATQGIRDTLARGLRDDCDVVVGMSTTRAQARIVEIAPGLSVPSQDEKFVVRIRGRGLGKAPIIENYVDPRSNVEQPLLPLRAVRGPDDFATALRNFDYVVDVVFASMSFPIAFAPQQIRYCFAAPVPPSMAIVERPICDAPERTEAFIDGGVYDNNPLRLAYNVARQGLRYQEDGDVFWRDPTEPPDKDPPYREMEFLYLDPDTPAYPVLPPVEDANSHELVSQAVDLVQSFVNTSRSRELYELVRSENELEGRMRLSKVHYPTASDHLYAFVGFLERDFRVFDYYLGMYDGFVTARSYVGEDPYAKFDLDDIVRRDGEFIEEWKPFACLLGWFETQYLPYRAACVGKDLRNFRILLQIAMDRIYSECSRLTPSDMGTFTHQHCEAATRRQAPPRIPGVRRGTSKTSWKRADEESVFSHNLRLLSEYHFEYKDMGLAPEEAEKGRYRIRRRILDLVKAITNEQSSVVDRTALLTIGRSALNEIAYESPPFYGYVVVGSAVEMGLSWTPFDWEPNWLRFNMALQTKGLFAALTLDGTGLQLTPMLGPEFEISPLTNSFVQSIVGVRGGYQFSTVDNFKLDTCLEDAANGDERRCSQMILEPYVAMTFIERLRVQLVAEIYAESFRFDDRRYNLLLGVGMHFF